MWFPVDEGMVNLERVAYIEVQDGYEIQFYNDHRAPLTKASFETEKQLRKYLEKLKDELSYPIAESERGRLPGSVSEPLLTTGDESDEGAD